MATGHKAQAEQKAPVMAGITSGWSVTIKRGGGLCFSLECEKTHSLRLEPLSSENILAKCHRSVKSFLSHVTQGHMAKRLPFPSEKVHTMLFLCLKNLASK